MPEEEIMLATTMKVNGCYNITRTSNEIFRNYAPTKCIKKKVQGGCLQGKSVREIFK